MAKEWCGRSSRPRRRAANWRVDRNASMHLLGQRRFRLHQYFCPEKSPADQLNEIDATVAIIRARRPQPLAAAGVGLRISAGFQGPASHLARFALKSPALSRNRTVCHADLLVFAELMIAVALIIFVLLQRSEGGALGMGGGGGGGLGGLFSPRGAADTLTRTTAILAASVLPHLPRDSTCWRCMAATSNRFSMRR